jgi:flagellar protein FliO/FliZ
MIWAASKMILGLGMVMVILFLFLRVLKKSQGTGDVSVESGIRLITTRAIAPQKYVSLIEIAGDLFAVGISQTQITLLTKVENKAFLEKLALRHSDSEPPSILQRLRSGSFRIGHEK